MLGKNEPKGTLDWFPEEFQIRKYIFDTWRSVCLRYGFEEYLTPLVENSEIYRAKSGEDVGGKELVSFRDLGDRELSIRPEMTPSVTRMVSKIYPSAPKPIKYFSIANFMRNEKPQRGRNREFWQLNCDIFGSSSISADIEIMQLALDIMLEFNAPANSFVLSINSRNLINDVLNYLKIDENKRTEVVRILDKWNKLSLKDTKERFSNLGLTEEQFLDLKKLMTSSGLEEVSTKLPEIKDGQGYKEIKEVISVLNSLGYKNYINFDPSVIRGFDYYDGLVFEVFDKNPENNRAIFGGGRYNGLANIFGEKDFPAVGFAPGDETCKLFLESWGLLTKANLSKKEKYYFPLLDSNLEKEARKLVKKLRKKDYNISFGLEVQKLRKALDFSDKKNIENVIIFGEDEARKGVYKIKDMKTGKEREFKY